MALSTQSPPPMKAPRIRAIRIGGLAFRFNLRVVTMTLIGLAFLLALGSWYMTLGSFRVPVVEVVRSVFGASSDDYEFIVRTLRLPRMLVAALAGCALALSGGIFQGLVRNPLVSPDIIGINAGATVVAVTWILTGQDLAYLPIAAFVGAIVTAGIIYVLTWQNGISGDRLILIGIGVSAVLGAFTTFLMLRYPVEQVTSAVIWSTGSVYASDWDDVQVLAIGLIILLPLAVGLMWPLRVLQFGDDTAHGLGVSVEPTRLALIVVGCGLSAISVAIVGPVGFVAFMTPHVARMLAGPMTGGVMLLTGILGAIFLLGSDLIAQHFLPVALPVGVVTAVVGAPYFLYLLYRANARL